MPVVRTLPEVMEPGRPLGGQASSLNTPAGAFGLGGEGLITAGKQLGQFSDKIDSVMRDRAERDDKVATKDRYLKFDDEANQMDRGLLSRKLLDARGTYDEGKEKLKTLMDKHASELSSPRQKELFLALAQTRYEAMLDRFNNHEQKQLETADEMSSKSMIVSAHRDAAADPYNPKAMADARTKTEIGVETLMKGADAETKRVALEGELSKLHRGVADAIAATGNAQGALAYVRQNEKEIKGDDLVSLKKSLRDEVDTQNAQGLADKAIAKFGTDYGAAQDWISKNASGGVENKALDQFRARSSMIRQADNEKREKNSASKAVAMMQAGNPVSALNIANGERDDETKLALLKLHRDLYPVEKPKPEIAPSNVAAASYLRVGIDTYKETGQPVQIGGKEYNLSDAGSIALAASQLGLDSANIKDVLSYHEKGGLSGSLKENEVKGVFESLTNKQIEENPTEYQYVLDYVKKWAPKGKEPDADTVRKLTSQALLNFKGGSGWFSSRTPAGEKDLIGWNETVGDTKAATGRVVSPPAFAAKLGINESLLVNKIKADGGNVSPETVDLYTRTWFMPTEARIRAARLLNELKKPVTEANIRAIWLKYGERM